MRFSVGGITGAVDDAGQVVVVANTTPGAAYANGPAQTLTGKLQGFQPLGVVDVRIVVRYEHVYVMLNGEVVIEYHRPSATAGVDSTPLEVGAERATIDVDSIHVEALPELGLRGLDKGDYRLPGIPPASGLRARYWPIDADPPTD